MINLDFDVETATEEQLYGLWLATPDRPAKNVILAVGMRRFHGVVLDEHL